MTGLWAMPPVKAITNAVSQAMPKANRIKIQIRRVSDFGFHNFSQTEPGAPKDKTKQKEDDWSHNAISENPDVPDLHIGKRHANQP